MFTYTGEMPRTYWQGLSDDELIAARNEYLSTDFDDLHKIAADIDDDLILRAAYREAAGETTAFIPWDHRAYDYADCTCGDGGNCPHVNEEGSMRLDSLAFLAAAALALVPVSLVVVFVARLAGAVAGVA